MFKHVNKEYVEEIRKLKSGGINKKKPDKKISFLPRLVVFLLGYILVFLFSKDPIAIIMIGSILGLTLFFITWAIQLYVRNKEVGFNELVWKKETTREEIEEERSDSTCSLIRGSPIWRYYDD